MSVVIPSDVMRDIVDAVVDTGAPLDAVTIRLYTNDVTPTPRTRLGDLVQATFDGYSPVTPVTWDDAWTDSAGNAHKTAQRCQFTCTGDTVSETVKGWYATTGSGAGDRLRACGRLPEGVPVSEEGDAVIVVPEIALPGPTDFLSEAS